jgi:hypothetical protein
VTALEGKRVKQGSAGARHSIVLTDDGEIYGWGDNEQGQLGELASETQLSPVLLWGFEDGKRPLFVVAGGEHTVAVFDMVPGNYSISGRERLVHVRFYDPIKHFPVLFASEGWPKQLFSCTCWLHDSVLF